MRGARFGPADLKPAARHAARAAISSGRSRSAAQRVFAYQPRPLERLGHGRHAHPHAGARGQGAACSASVSERVGLLDQGAQHAPGNASIYVCAQPGATGTVSAKCPVPLSNIRLSGSGSPQLSKFRVYYADGDAGGTGSQVYVAFNKKYIAGASVPIDLVCNPWDSNVDGRAVETATSATSVCPTPYVFQARTFYNLAVRLTAGPADGPRCTQFYGIDFP